MVYMVLILRAIYQLDSKSDEVLIDYQETLQLNSKIV